MATFTCYLPDELLERLDAKLGEGPDFNYGRASRSGILRVLLEQYLSDQPATVKDVFADALGADRARRTVEVPVVGNGPPIPGGMDTKPRTVSLSRADVFHRATQR